MKLISRQFIFFLCLATAITRIASSQSPQDSRWEDFIGAHSGRVSLPEDEILGVLADIRTPDPAWASALKICNTVFHALEKGVIPAEVFYEPVRLPLTISFNRILEAGPRRAEYRYGGPVRKGNRIIIPIRLTNSDEVTSGNIYLVLVEKDWHIEQWALDISGLPILEMPKSDPSEPKTQETEPTNSGDPKTTKADSS